VVHPLTTDGRAIYAVANGNVYAVDTTGVTRWTAEVQATGPAVASEVGILVPCKSGGLTLLAPKTGAVIRQTSAAGPTHAMPVFLEGVMAWVTTEGVLATSDGGRQRVTSAAMSDIASDGTRIFVGTAKGEFFAIDRTGILWQRSLPGPAVAHPIVTKDMVYMTFGPHEGEPGGVTALGRKDGLTKWTSTMRMGPAAGPALGEVLLVPGKSGELVALDPRSGGTRWRAPGYGAYSVKPVIVGETAFAGNADGRLHRVDLHDGGEVWAVELGATITGDPVLVDGRLVVGLTDGRLVSLR
jgi:outer membrane protein assembly factor BamB